MNIHKLKLKEGLKGMGPCDKVKAGDRRYYQWQDTRDESSDPLSDTIALMDHSDNNIILDHICESQGGVFVKYEDPGSSTGNLHQDASEMLAELTDVYVVMSKSMKDGKIDMQEAAEIRKEAKEAMQKIEIMLDNVQRGKYK